MKKLEIVGKRTGGKVSTWLTYDAIFVINIVSEQTGRSFSKTVADILKHNFKDEAKRWKVRLPKCLPQCRSEFLDKEIRR